MLLSINLKGFIKLGDCTKNCSINLGEFFMCGKRTEYLRLNMFKLNSLISHPSPPESLELIESIKCLIELNGLNC